MDKDTIEYYFIGILVILFIYLFIDKIEFSIGIVGLHAYYSAKIFRLEKMLKKGVKDKDEES